LAKCRCHTHGGLANRDPITFMPTAEKSTGGRPATLYHVNKRDSYVMVTTPKEQTQESCFGYYLKCTYLSIQSLI